MKVNDSLFSFRFATLFSLLVICSSDAQVEPGAVFNDCDINMYIKYLFNKWISNSWSQGTSERCMGHILLQWAYQLREALEGKTTMEKNIYLDKDTNNLETKCDEYLRRRTNRSSSDALHDVFNLLFKLTKILKEDADWCFFTSTDDDDVTFYDQTLTLVRRMNSFIRQQNRMNL